MATRRDVLTMHAAVGGILGMYGGLFILCGATYRSATRHAWSPRIVLMSSIDIDAILITCACLWNVVFFSIVPLRTLALSPFVTVAYAIPIAMAIMDMHHTE